MRPLMCRPLREVMRGLVAGHTVLKELPAHRQLQPGDMKDTKTRNSRGGPDGNDPEIGVVRVFSNPGPDAEDRLRRLFSLLVRHATRDGQTTSENGAPTDARRAGDHPEAED